MPISKIQKTKSDQIKDGSSEVMSSLSHSRSARLMLLHLKSFLQPQEKESSFRRLIGDSLDTRVGD
jgi:hypothetical protein